MYVWKAGKDGVPIMDLDGRDTGEVPGHGVVCEKGLHVWLYGVVEVYFIGEVSVRSLACGWGEGGVVSQLHGVRTAW